MSVPKTMRGVLVSELGKSDVNVLKDDLSVPAPSAGEVLIKNKFAGVNFIDTYFRGGLYPKKLPYIPGGEGSGTVVSLGSGNTYGLKEGDEVVYWGGSGSYAEYASAGAGRVLKLPEDVSADTAAASLLQGLTALTLVTESYPAKKGDWILVHAAAGGTGRWIVAFLKDIGARVIATASSAEKLAISKAEGAEVLINYSTENWKEKVLETTGGEGVAAVYDGVGKNTFDGSLDCVKRNGTLVSFGNASGAVEGFRILRLSAKNVKLLRPTLFNYVTTDEEFQRHTKTLFDFIKAKKITSVKTTVYDIADTKQAQDDLEGRKTTGKVLLKL